MRVTAKFFAIGVACGLALGTSVAQAGWSLSGVTATMMLGQNPAPSESEKRREAERWLGQAREAMQNGKLDLAQMYVERAEKLNVQYDPVFAKLMDTPAKVRQDLEAMRQASASRAAAPNAGGSFQPGGASTAPSAASSAPATASRRAIGDRQGQSTQLLLNARRAIAMADLTSAQRFVAEAKQLGLSYPPHADSPANVESLLVRAADFLSGKATAGDQQVAARNFAEFLMDQSEAFVKYQEFDQAYKLAQQAKQIPVDYQSFDRTPDKMLQQIAAARGAGRSLSDQPQGGNAKAQALQFVAQAKAALDRGDVMTAERFAQQAQALRVPDSAFAANEPRPWEVMLEVSKAKSRYGVAPAAYNAQQAGGELSGGSMVQQGVYNPAQDPTRNVAAQSLQPTPAVPTGPQGPLAGSDSPGVKAFQQGLDALNRRDRQTALQHFREAWRYESQLDPITRQQLQDKLTLLQTPESVPVSPSQQPNALEAISSEQQLLKQKLYREITAVQAEAEQLRGSDPKEALATLQRLRDRIAQSGVDPASRKQLLSLVERNITGMEQFIDRYRGDIELDERNREIMQGIELTAERRNEINNKIAELVDEFNTLLDEQRFAEAELKAKQARELDPNSEIVQNLMWKSRFARRFVEQNSITEAKEQSFYDAMVSVDRASTPFDDSNPIQWGDKKAWEFLSKNRGAMLEQSQRLSQEELEIYRSMKNKVDVKFTERPLGEVMDILSELAGVPIVLDPQGLAAEGITSDTPVTLRLNQQISLKSALQLILEPLRLSYVINNEVLRVTSEQTRDSNTYTQVYNVADLVIPIPNFVPGYNVGLPGAIQAAHNALGYGGNIAPGGSAPLTLAANGGTGAMNSNANVLAQIGAAGMSRSLSNQPPQPNGFGPGGMGGAALADFDTLIELITSTIAPDSWDEVGGAGAIEPFPTNLSLVISQTQDVHEQIADLLEQLRRLQDLQVTIEVRFITLNDNFFERIGIDFDFDIDDNVNLNNIRNSGIAGGAGDDSNPSVVIGLDQQGPTVDLDIPFFQDGFGAAVPQFGGFDAATAANFGFAILSDIEVFFLLEAAQGDTRSNVLQAPKVTLFNGQTASVNDITQRPFVTSIIPVVGDFAAAQQPVIVVLSEGTSLSVQAVVSSDRRFVRLTLVPFFSRIGDVEEFTFEGRTTTDTGTVIEDQETGQEVGRENEVVTREGTTVQLPTFIFTTVSTTVSVPDGGTVLLGGIKRLSEGRTERGVPMLGKLPYINRLFKNVGIGRTTQSLMMMVTPRIIIQEEEEISQTGYIPGN